MALESAGLKLLLEGGQAFMSGVGAAEKATKGLLGTFADAGKAVAGATLAAGAAGAVALGAGIGVAAKAGLDFNNAMEQTTAKLNAFTKDGKVSAKILEDIKKEAAATPFAFEEMATATASLLPVAKASGKELMSLVKTAEVLAASNPAEGLEGAAFALKEAASGDLTSVIERFNLPRQRLKELKDQGVPAIEAVGIAMKELGLDADLVSNMANTAAGRWSTFQDTLTNLAAIATKPIFDAFSQGLGDVNGLLEANMPLLQNLASLLAEQLAGAIAGTIQTIRTFIESWGIASEYTSSFLEQFGAVIDLMIGSEGTFQNIGIIINDTFATAGQIFDTLVTSIQGAINQAGGFAGIWANLQTTLAPVIATLQTLWQQIGGIEGVIAGAQGALATFSGAWQELQNAAQAAASGYAAIISAVFGQVNTFIQAHGTQIAAFMGQAWEKISAIVQVAAQLYQAVIPPILQAVAAFINAHGAEIQAILGAAWTAVSSLVNAALALIYGIIKTALQLIKGDWQGAWQTFQAMSAEVMQNILQVIQSTLQIIMTVWSTMLNEMKAVFESIFSSIVGWVVQSMTGIKNAIIAAAGGLAGAAQSAGSQIISGIKAGIEAGVSGLVSAAVNAVKSALSAAKAALGIASPSKVAAKEIGVPFTQGVAQGILDAVAVVQRSTKKLAQALLQDMQQIGESAARMLSDSIKAGLSFGVSTARGAADAIETSRQLADISEEQRKLDQINGKLATATDEERVKLLEQQADAMQRVQDAEQRAIAIQQQYNQAQAEAAAIAKTDPKLAQQYYQLRSNQIEELYRLENDLRDAGTDAERAAIEQRIALIQQAQAAEIASYRNSATEAQKSYDEQRATLQKNLDDIMKKVTIDQNLLANPKTRGKQRTAAEAELGQLNPIVAALQASIAQIVAYQSGLAPFATGGGGMLGGQTTNNYYNLGVTTNQSTQLVTRSFALMQAVNTAGVV